MTTRLTHILALWLALLMGGQSFASAASVAVCRMAGAPMKACPCAPHRTAPAESSAASIALESETSCCDVLEASSAEERPVLPTVVTQWELARAEAPAPLSLPIAVVAAQVQQPAPAYQPVAPSGAIYLRLRQLLI